MLDAVASSLRRLDPAHRVVVAFSGGVDSIVLLDAVARAWPKEQVVAWHVHHALQPQADDWVAHCERQAARLGLRFSATRLPAPPARGVNVEAWARQARYRALWDAVASTGSQALLTAHHADDQLETVLMRLARGSGPAAIAGMAPMQRRAGGWLLRPLLAVGRECVVDCARERGLAWVEDPMNEDDAYLRVVLRTRVIPELARAVPSLRENVLRSAAWLREGGEALRERAEVDLREAGVAPAARSVDRRRLAALPAARRDRAVRAWFDELGAPMPDRARLAAWVSQMLLAGSASADFRHERLRFRRYRDSISVHDASADDAAAAPPPWTFRWRGEREIALPGWGGVLRFTPSARADGVAADWLATQSLEVRAARSGERLRPRSTGPRRTLKNLFQEHGVPPYLRVRLPALHAGDRLLYVAGIGMDRCATPSSASDPTSSGGDVAASATARAPRHEARIEIDWHPDRPDDVRAAFCVRVPPV